MAPYEVVYDRKAVRDARRLSPDVRQRIREFVSPESSVGDDSAEHL